MSINGKQIDFKQELSECSDIDLLIHSQLIEKTKDAYYGRFPIKEARLMIGNEMRRRINERGK